MSLAPGFNFLPCQYALWKSVCAVEVSARPALDGDSRLRPRGCGRARRLMPGVRRRAGGNLVVLVPQPVDRVARLSLAV
jgi:hypothetical protein